MTKDQIKRIAKVVIPLLVAVAATYGYVDAPAPNDCPPVLETPDAGE